MVCRNIARGLSYAGSPAVRLRSKRRKMSRNNLWDRVPTINNQHRQRQQRALLFSSNTHSFKRRNNISQFSQPLSPVWNSFILIHPSLFITGLDFDLFWRLSLSLPPSLSQINNPHLVTLLQPNLSMQGSTWPEGTRKTVEREYREEKKSLYVVARCLLLQFLNCSARPCLGPAFTKTLSQL